MTFTIHFTCPAHSPILQLKETNMTTAPAYLPLFNCLKRMYPVVNYPRLRFILPRGPGASAPDARLDFYYFPEDDTIHIHYRERHNDSIYLGFIDSDGQFVNKPFPEQSKVHIGALLMNLKTDFPRAIESYGQHTYTCALCGQPLIDPSSLARGTTPNCAPHLLPQASLEDI